MSKGTRYKYEDYHRINEKGELEKKCVKHEIYFPNEDPWFLCSLEYFYKNDKNKTDGLHPECKKCGSQKAIQQWKDDPIKHREAHKKYEQTKKFKKWMRKNQEEMKDYRIQYRKDNKDKMHIYNIKRKLHKKHNITNIQILQLYKYANSSCMYCGMTEEEHKKKFGEKLHKDHAYNEGSNDIYNCVLACKSCNSEKHTSDWNVWYTPENPKYTYEKYKAIENWLSVECKKVSA